MSGSGGGHESVMPLLIGPTDICVSVSVCERTRERGSPFQFKKMYGLKRKKKNGENETRRLEDNSIKVGRKP